MSQSTLAQEPSTDRPLRQKKTLDDYEFLINENAKVKTSDLGKGSYGSVKKVREKSSGEIFAMKILTKKSIFAYATKENLKREISIQKSITHPNIIKLYHYFEDKENVYLVLEFAENGTLFQYLRKRRKLDEQEAFIYFLQTCLGIDYLHKRKILHRDLKPENLLLNKDSNIKLCDFGWSAENHSKRHTFCGTVDYMAPEMVKNQPYDHKLDIWCLGVLLYEILHGYAPFKGKSDTEKCRNIAQNVSIEFNSDLSREVVDLIRKILRPNPTERLSMDEIFNHPWMRRYEREYNMSIQGLIKEQDELVKDAQIALQKAEKAKTLTFDKNQQNTKVDESLSYDTNEKNSTDYTKDTYSYGTYESKGKGYEGKSNAAPATKAKDNYSYEKEYKDKYSDFAAKSYQTSSKTDGSDYSYKKTPDYGSSMATAYNKPEESAYSYQAHPSQNREQEKSSTQKADNVFFKFLNSGNPSQFTQASDIASSYPSEPYVKKQQPTDYTYRQETEKKAGYSQQVADKKPDYTSYQEKEKKAGYSSQQVAEKAEKKVDYVQSYEPYLNKIKEQEKSTFSNPQQQADNVFYKFLQTNPNTQMSKSEDDYSTDYSTKYKPTGTGAVSKPTPTSATKDPKEVLLSAYEESYNNYFKNKEALKQERTKKFPQDQPSVTTTSTTTASTTTPPVSHLSHVSHETKLRSYTPDKPSWQDSKMSPGASMSPYTSEKPAWMGDSGRINAEKVSYNTYDYDGLRPEDSTYRKPTLYVNQYQSNQEDVDNYLAKNNNLFQKKQSMPLDDISSISRPYYDPYGQDYQSHNAGARSRSFDDKEFRRKRSLNQDNSQKGEKEKKSRNVDYDKGTRYRTIEEEHDDDYDAPRDYRQKKKGKGKRKQKENEPNFIERILIGIGCITRSEKENY